MRQGRLWTGLENGRIECRVCRASAICAPASAGCASCGAPAEDGEGEITRANQHLAPADYERKQTLANAERFTTPELKEYEHKVLDAEEKILSLEKDLFTDVRRRAGAEAQRIRATAAAVAELDVTATLAQAAAARTGTIGRGFPRRARCASWWSGIRSLNG